MSLSAQAQGLPSRPNLVRAALENSAAPLGNTPHDVLTHGRGLLQVDK
jgi:tripeptidyl-peptidase-2